MKRREFIISSAAGAAVILTRGLGLGSARPAAAATLAVVGGGSQDPTLISQFVSPLVIPPAMPRKSQFTGQGGQTVDYYEIAVRQFQQQILPPGMPKTTVWSYGAVKAPGTVAQGGSFNYPAFTIEATQNRPVRVKWINDLVDSKGNYLPHLLPVDQTIHWANPPGGLADRDMGGMDPTPYKGPVPIVTHVHGAHVRQEYDGFPEAWYLAAARDIPKGYATTGTSYDSYKVSAPLGSSWTPGSTVFEYPNDQRATTLWYHDHTLGMTRLNVYAGPAGFYLLRGGTDDKVLDSTTGLPAALPRPAPALGDPAGMSYYEIPIAIQDRSFNDDGSLFFPDSRAFFDGFEGPYAPDSDIAPIFNPEFFGNTMVVNGKTWPYLNVEQRRYRFRLLNGCNSRFLILEMSNGLGFWQIGTEGGFLPNPVELSQLLLGLAERADVIVDFSNVPIGTEITLQNLGPDEPFGGGTPGVDFAPADPATTGRVMQFRVVARVGPDKSTPVENLKLPAFQPLGTANVTRKVSLNELDSEKLEGVGPRKALLGTVGANGLGEPLAFDDPATELPKLGDTEIWEIHNYTEDAHPIHVHLVQFQVVNREAMVLDKQLMLKPPPPRGPEPWETGYKDTVIAYPGEITRIKAKFDLRGRYVWHCHIVDHEDNEMMRPYLVV